MKRIKSVKATAFFFKKKDLIYVKKYSTSKDRMYFNAGFPSKNVDRNYMERLLIYVL